MHWGRQNQPINGNVQGCMPMRPFIVPNPAFEAA